MDNFMRKCLPMACFIFFGLIGFLLTRYVYKNNEFNGQKPKQEENQTEIPSLASPQKHKAHGYKNGATLNAPEQSTNH